MKSTFWQHLKAKMVRHLNNYHSSNSGRGKDKHDIEGSASLKCIEDTDAHANFHPQLFPTRKPTSKQASKNQLEDCDGVIRVPSGSGYRMMKPFPWLLHEMLDDIEEKKLSWIVSWMPDGKAFQVHSAERFADTILPTYFRHKRYKSFQVRMARGQKIVLPPRREKKYLISYLYLAPTISIWIQVSSG